MLTLWKKSYDKTRQHSKKQRHHLADKGLYSQNYGLSSSHVRMWELDPEEGRVPKNRCFQTMVLEKIFESPLNIKEIKLINPKGNQPWIFTGRTDLEAWDPILWPLDVKSWLIGKDPDAGKDRRQKEKRMRWLDDITDAMVMNLGKLWEMVRDREVWHAPVTKSQTQLGDWTTTWERKVSMGWI